jgi:peroxiredoxin Q/BCP
MLTVPETGSKAPLFKAEDQNGEMVSLADFKGKKVALYFYPKDNTPTCTTQACNFRDNYTLLQQRGIVVLGVSVDNIKSHKKFEQKFSLPFTLISDHEHEIATKYGVWGLKKFMGREFMGVHRTTFLINEKGVIEHIITKVKSKEHTAQILELWK